MESAVGGDVYNCIVLCEYCGSVAVTSDRLVVGCGPCEDYKYVTNVAM